MYIAKWGNKYYTEKQLGSDTDIQDKFVGGLFCTALLALLIGPFLFFSDVAGFIQTNPATGAQISLALVIDKTVSRADLLENDAAVKRWTSQVQPQSLNITGPAVDNKKTQNK